MRYRLDEIKTKTISQLRELCKGLGLDISDCLDKSEVVDKIVKSGLIDVTEGLPVVDITHEEFYSKNVSQLKHLLLSYGISCENAIEKSELRSLLLDSNRIVVAPEVLDEKTDNLDTLNAPRSSVSMSGLKDASSFAQKGDRVDCDHNRGVFSLSQMKAMDESALREISAECNISLSGCLDRTDIIERLLLSDRITILDDRADAKANDNRSSQDLNSKTANIVTSEADREDDYVYISKESASKMTEDSKVINSLFSLTTIEYHQISSTTALPI